MRTLLTNIAELTTNMEIRRADGTWVGVKGIESVEGVGVVDLEDGRFAICGRGTEIMSREVTS